MKKPLKITLAVCGALVVLGGILLTALHFGKETPEPVAEETTTAVTTTTMPEVTETTTTTTTTIPAVLGQMAKEDGSQPYLTVAKAAELKERAEVMRANYRDFVGWVYIANSRISYPVMRANDNDYYMHRNPNRQYEFKGSIFMDYRSKQDMSSETTVIYGHNMNAGTMFADIRNFRTKSAWNAHQYGWLFTGETVYRIDFFALSVLSAYDELYNLAYFEPLAREPFIQRAYATAHFRKDMEFADDDRIVTLSTCAYDFDMARQIITGKLVEMTDESQYVR